MKKLLVFLLSLTLVFTLAACGGDSEGNNDNNDNDDTADFQYVKHFLMDNFRTLGSQFGVEYAEAFRYIGPPPDYASNIRGYTEQHAVSL